MASAPETSFDDFFRGGWDYFQALPGRRFEESLWIDFKRKPDASRGAVETEDKQHLAEALSGFANADGGVIVWGVEAKPDQDDIDAVTGLHPIADVRRFVSDLRGLESLVVADAVPGVRQEAILNPNGDGSGFALTLVPRSESTPHMAIARSQHRYYQRAGRSFQMMEHHQVADLFGRRPLPKLRVQVVSYLTRMRRPATGDDYQVWLEFYLSNEGKALAEWASLSLLSVTPMWLESLRQKTHSKPFADVIPPRGYYRRWTAYQQPLFPGDRFLVVSMAFGFPGIGVELEIPYEAVARGAAVESHVEKLPMTACAMAHAEARTRPEDQVRINLSPPA